MASETVEILIDGGKATPGPPLGPAIGPLGINMMQVVEQINQKTADFDGMKVPVKIIVDSATKEFEVEVGTPPTTALIMDELKIEKGSQDPGIDKVADLKMEQALKIARMKFDTLLSPDYKNAAKEIIGTCVSMGITVEGKDPREVQKEVDEGIYDKVLVQES
jgi:large subunit ribosomal protein L11